MKAALSLFLTLIFTTLSAVTFANSPVAEQINDSIDYCYKPSKPLFLSTAKYKNNYAEDMKEYQRCRQSFMDMQARVLSMKEESEKHAKKIRESFVIRYE